MSKAPGENNIIEEILNGNEKVLAQVYKYVYKQIELYSLSLNISVQNAKEAVQDAFEVFYRQILDSNLNLTCSVETYIISIARRLLLKNAPNWNVQYNSRSIEQTEAFIDDSEDSKFEKEIEDKRSELFRAAFKTLPMECQQLLSLTIEEYSANEIMQKMGISTIENLRNKRAKCKKNLVDKIKENPAYEKLRNANREDYELPL